MSNPPSVPDSALGLTSAEIQILRHQQQIQQQRHQAETASRGRGNSRSSQPSSRAASAASSQGGQGRLFLDPGSLQQLIEHFEQLMRRIQDRIEVLENATQNSVEASCDRAGNMIQSADAQIARMKRILAEIDHLEEEFVKIKHIREVVRRLRARIDEADARLDRSHGHGHGHGHSHSGRDPRRR